jgi:hypothetical protein
MADPFEHDTVCPYCATKSNTHRRVGPDEESNVPVEGDFSLCAYCRRLTVCTYTDSVLTMRLPIAEELREALTDPAVALLAAGDLADLTTESFRTLSTALLEARGPVG